MTMGKQINFYMHGDDELQFLAAARQRAEVLVLPYRSATEKFEPLKDLPQAGEAFAYGVWLWSPTECAPYEVEWVEPQRSYYVNRFASEVIEFSRSFEDEGALVRGRIWAEMVAIDPEDPNSFIRKSASFEKWFDSLVRWIKKNYEKVDGPIPEYVGHGAAKFKREGGKLKQVAMAKTVKLVQHDL